MHSCHEWTFGAAAKPYTLSAYDTLGRLASRTAPDGGVTTSSYVAQPDAGPVTTTVTNPRTFVTKYVRNVRSELVQVIDANNKTTAYQYSPLGHVTKVTDSLGNFSTTTYNKYGWVTAKSDLDLGSWTYAYDPLGQRITQTDAKAQVTSLGYDALGRLTQRVEPSMIATWAWDGATKGIGKIASTATNGSVTRAYTYDAYGRPATESMSVDGIAYTVATGYDSSGRPETLTYPTGFAAKNVYNAVGYLAEVRNHATNALYWKVVTQSPSGITDEDMGNGTGLVRVFNANTHRVSQISAVRDSDSAVLQNFTFGYDLAGNLTARSETTQGLSETFAFDSLDRLTTVTGPASKSYTYSEIGNITSKSDVGSYTYPSSGKVHAVSNVAGVAYTYDLNGNLSSAGSRTLTWTSFDMPSAAQVGGSSYTWAYDADRRRVKHGAPTETTIYVSAGDRLMVEKVTIGGVTEHRHQIYAGGMPVSQFTQRSAGANDTRYLYRDHLGSTTLIADEPGAVTERLAYDAQGKRRFPSGGDDSGGTLTGLATDRGFTGHEHLDALGLIHMNGRLYDPKIGRFVSADPVWSNLLDPQSWNRYSYVLNNPFKYTDPSGHEPTLLSQVHNQNWGFVGGIGPSWLGSLGDRRESESLVIDRTQWFPALNSNTSLGNGVPVGSMTVTAQVPPLPPVPLFGLLPISGLLTNLPDEPNRIPGPFRVPRPDTPRLPVTRNPLCVLDSGQATGTLALGGASIGGALIAIGLLIVYPPAGLIGIIDFSHIAITGVILGGGVGSGAGVSMDIARHVTCDR